MTITILTGVPGVGKSTAVIRAARALKDRGLNVGGIVSRELRTNNIRVGFEFIDLGPNDTGVLASITGNGPKIRKYFIDLGGCHFAAERLCRAIKNCDVIICDEIGPMELKSREFIYSVKNLLVVDKKVIVVVHHKLEHPVIEQFKKKSRLIINIDLQNRAKVNQILLNRLLV
jgi:nucleoside-triphosphatase